MKTMTPEPKTQPSASDAAQASWASPTGSAHNTLTLKWGTLKGWDVKTPEAIELLKAYHAEPVSFSVMMQRDTPNQKEILIKLIGLCDEIWLDWEGKQASRDEAKEYLRTYWLRRLVGTE